MAILDEMNLGDIPEEDPVRSMKELFDQTILLLGQAMNTCAHTRRFNVLMEFIGDKLKADNLLKDSVISLAKDSGDNLFGPKFEEHMTKTLNLTSQKKFSLQLA